MAENDEGLERSERATPRRRQKAREEGSVARSRELNSAMLLLAGSLGLFALGGGLLAAFKEMMRHGLSVERERIFSEPAMLGALGERVAEGFLAAAPLLALLTVAAVIAPLAVGGWVFNPGVAGFRGNRLNPVEGMKRVFSRQGLMELAKAFAKFVLIALVAVWLLWRFGPQLLGLANAELDSGIAWAASLLGWSLIALAGSLALIAAVDVPFQLWRHGQELRMTRQEVRDEFKETEGRPEVKGKIRRLQQEMARRRMMAEVPKADVVVTNPTHFAVALKYDQGKHRAPVVVAKGADLIAAEIRRIAIEARVPRLEAPPLARALYHSTDLGREIPEGLYLAVARVLAWVFQLRTAPGYVAPPAASELLVPADLTRH
jgi:flagellar biosynthetic protein FlhB